jgi:hypothetical protein
MMNPLESLGARSKAIATFALGALVAALVLALVTAVLTSATKSTEIRDQQEQNSPLIENTDQTLQIIEGCTTPGRACYERGQRQLAKAVGDINRVVVLAAACASGPVARTEAEIRACVLKQLPGR